MLDDNSIMSKIIGYRLYEKPSKNYKTQEAKEHRFRMEMKRKYALPQKQENGFEKLWSYVEHRKEMMTYE